MATGNQTGAEREKETERWGRGRRTEQTSLRINERKLETIKGRYAKAGGKVVKTKPKRKDRPTWFHTYTNTNTHSNACTHMLQPC